MASLNLDENSSNFQIYSYKAGSIRINEKIFTQSIIVTPQRIIENWLPQHFSELNLAAFKPIFELNVDIILLGTGETQLFLANDLYAQLLQQGKGLEIMNTFAACRTFNALSAENRNVAAALLL